MVLSCDAAKLDTAAQPDTTPGLPDSDSRFSLGPGPTSFYPPKPAGNGASCIPLWQPCLCLSFPGDSLEKVHWAWMAQIVKMLPTAQCCPHHASSAHQNHTLGGVLSTEVSSMQLPERRANIAQVGLKTTAILLPLSPGC